MDNIASDLYSIILFTIILKKVDIFNYSFLGRKPIVDIYIQNSVKYKMQNNVSWFHCSYGI